MLRIVAWTNAPRLAALDIWQPDWAGVMPLEPVSWYGVARPVALSGFAGTIMSQLTLTAVVVAAAEPLADALAEALALAPSAAWLMVEFPPPETAMKTPMPTPSATGMASGTAMRAIRLWPVRRRHADLRPAIIRFHLHVCFLLLSDRLGRPACGRDLV